MRERPRPVAHKDAASNDTGFDNGRDHPAPRTRTRGPVPAAVPAPLTRERVRVNISTLGHVATTTGRTRADAPNGANPPRTRGVPPAIADKAAPAPSRTRVAVPRKRNIPADYGVEDPDTGKPLGPKPPTPPNYPEWWEPGMPKQWPNGSSYMTGPGMPGYKPFTSKPGIPDEMNPNLRGRVYREPGEDKYSAYRWLPKLKRYKPAGKHINVYGAFAVLRTVHR